MAKPQPVDCHLFGARVNNIYIGEKDWPSRMCTGLFNSLIDRKGFNLEFAKQNETKLGVFGHYFEQAQYQQEIGDPISQDIREICEVY